MLNEQDGILALFQSSVLRVVDYPPLSLSLSLCSCACSCNIPPTPKKAPRYAPDIMTLFIRDSVVMTSEERGEEMRESGLGEIVLF